MILNITYDSSVDSAPVGFTGVVAAAVSFLESNFTDPVTVNIGIGYGTVNSQPLNPGALGQSLTYLSSYTYAQIKAAFAADAKSPDDASVVASLPASDPTGNGHYWATLAEAKALGLSNSSTTDGYIGFSASPSIFDFDMSDGIGAGQYDFFGAFLHEVTEVMGRQLLVGDTIGGLPNSYDPMDLLHFSALGVRDFAGTQAGYFSPDNGATNLGDFNTTPGGDFGDWSSSVGHDAFLAFSGSGFVNGVSPSDIRVMDAIGWDIVSMPNLTAVNVALSITNVTFTIGSTGSGDAPTSTTGIYLSTNNTITPADTLLTTVATPALAHGLTDNEGVSVPLPDSLAQGTYYIGVFADYAGELTESNESDNGSNTIRVMLGNTGNNTLTGTSSSDTMFGFSGNDSLNGAAGKDAMIGGAGDDFYAVDNTGDVVTENPDEGNDSVRASVSYTLAASFENLTLTGNSNISGTGNAGANAISGNTGNNVLTGLGGADSLDGGSGIDSVSYAGSALGVNVSLMTGHGAGGDAEGDVLLNFEKLTGSSFNDTLEGDGGDNSLSGGSGTDTLSFEHASGGATFSLALSTAQNTGGAGIDTVSQFENLNGSAQGDVLTGSSGNNAVSGGDGDDSIDGGSGSGKDTLDGGTGADTLVGGNGNDLYVIDNNGDVAIETPTGGTDTVNVSLANYALGITFENLTFIGIGTFSGTGNDLANTMTGAAGNDTLDAGLGSDKLIGGTGDDQLLGGGGNDSLSGDAGADSMSGGLGSDRFIFTDVQDFTADALRDTILDFVHSQKDKIDLSAIDANSTVDGNQAFVFIGAQAFHNVAGELRYTVGGPGVTVSGDVDGNGLADFNLDLAAVSSLVSNDFVL